MSVPPPRADSRISCPVLWGQPGAASRAPGAFRGNNDPHRGRPGPKSPGNDWLSGAFHFYFNFAQLRNEERLKCGFQVGNCGAASAALGPPCPCEQQCCRSFC